MDNQEEYLDALTAYSRNPTPEIPQILEQYLNGVAKNGETLFQWPLLKPLIVGKMEKVIGELKKGLSSENIPTRPNVENVRFEVMHSRIMDALQKFNGAPFTIQRLCELLIAPKQHYKRSDKFLRGLEKNVLVVSTVDPFGRKVVSETSNKHLVNGMDTNGSPFFPRDSNITSNLPPVPGWITSSVTTRPATNNTPEDTTEEEKTQTAPQDTHATNGVAGGIVSSLYGDNGEQPMAIHAEEVVEETVVTMDTTEGGPVATDGGEAMADDEGDDTNTSSSSSSSEELIPSDGNESAGVSSDDSRPWASITKDLENKKEKTEIVPTINDPPSTSATQSTDTSVSSKETEQNLPDSENSEHLSDSSQSSLNQSFGFLAAAENPPSSSTDSKLDIESDGADSSHTDSAIDTAPSEADKVRTYAEVVSTSNSSHSPPGDSTEECDSVAGLERLVESVEPESSTQHQPSPSLIPTTHQSSEADHSDTSDSDEPRAKRMKLSHESVTSPEPDTTDVLQSDRTSSSPVHPSSQPSSSPSLSSETNSVVTPESSEVIDEETQVTSGSDSNSSIVHNPDKVMETVSSGSEETESLTPVMVTTEIPGSDNVVNDDENVTSPPSHLSSSSDSQGFDVCGDSLSKYNADSKQTAAECADKKDDESGTDSPKQESMDQD